MISEYDQSGAVDLIETPEEGAIDLTPSVDTPPIVDEKELDSVVQKTDYALGEVSPGREEILSSFILNQGSRFEKMAAAEEAMRLRREFRQEADNVLKTAVAEGRSLTPEEVEYIATLQGRTPVKPEVAVEKRFGDRIAVDTLKNELAEIEQFTSARNVTEETGDYLAKQQVALKILQETKRKYDESSWTSWSVDFAKNLFPGYNWWKMTDRIEGAIADSLWTGTNVEQQMRSLYLMPLDQFEERLRAAVESLSEDNIINAAAFANYAVQFSSTDAALENLFFSLDVLDILPAASIAGAGAIGITRSALRSKVKSVAEELANPNLSKTDVSVLKGEAQAGAEAKVMSDLSAAGVLEGFRPERLAADLSKSSFGLMDHESYLRSAGSLTNESQRRIRDVLEKNKNILMSNVMPGQNTHVIRMSPEAIDKGLKLARDEQARLYPHLEDHVVEVRPVRESEEIYGGVDYIEVWYGKKDASAFTSEKAARNYAKNFLRVDPEMFTPVQKGDSWYLKVERSVDETSLELADLRLKTGHEAPENWVNRFIGGLRMSDAVRGQKSGEWAKVATWGSQATAERLAEVTKTLGRMGKNETDRLETILKDAQFKTRTVVDPKTNQPVTVQGVFYKNQMELEQAYLSKGFSLPSQAESTAYWTFRQLMDYDLLQRNIARWRDKARLGLTQHEVSWVRKGEGGVKEKITLPPFEGRVRQSLPEGEFTIAWSDAKTGKSGFALSSQRGWFKEVNKLLDDDYKIIQVFDQNSKELKDAVRSGGEPVQYVVVRDWKEKPLSFHQVPAAEGGHWMYPQTGGYVKQPQLHGTKFGRTIYDGDLTVHWLGREADAKQMAQRYETARQMYLSGDPRFASFVDENLPYDAKTLKQKFEDKTFDPQRPFVFTQHGQSTGDILKLSEEGVFDPRASAHSLEATVSSNLTQQRDRRLTSVAIDQSQQNPSFKLYGAPVLDPLKAMTRGLSDLARSRYFEDYVHQTAENFMTQFGDTLKASAAELRADPMRFIREPVWKEGVDPKHLAAAKTLRRNLLYLLGQDSYDLGLMKTFKQKILDSVLQPYGKSGRLLERYQWTKDADPAVVARSAVFDLYLGLFNPLQFPLQAQGATLVAAIDGSMTRAAQANFLYWSARMRGMASTNKGAQSLIGKATARALGLSKDVVDEAYEAFLTSGMSVFGGAYNRLDDFLSPKLFEQGKGPMRKFLDAGRVFFKEGNLTHQGTAFMTSYLRWKQSPGNKYKKPNQRDMAAIVDRANLYYNDMTRASSSALLSQSAISIPVQFSAFHRNLSELLLGTRLTVSEKARVMMMYSLLYGAPVGNPVSMATTPLWPMSESIRQSMLEEGMDTDSSFLLNTYYNGIAQAFLNELTGTNYDTERYAPGGLPWMKELLDGNFLEVIQGPSGTGLARMLETVAPFYHAMMGVFAGPEDDTYSLTVNDFVDAARNIATVNNAVKAYYALTTGRLLTKGEALQTRIDADGFDALLIGALGLVPQEVTDAYAMIRSNKEADEAKAAITKEAMVQFRRGLRAVDNPKEAETFFRNAKALLQGAGLTPLEVKDVWRRAMRENEDLIEQISPNFMTRDPEKRLPRFQQQIDEKYGQ